MMSQAQTTAPDQQICSVPLYKGFPSRTSSSSGLPHVKENRSTAQPCSTVSGGSAIADLSVWANLRPASKLVLIAISPIKPAGSFRTNPHLTTRRHVGQNAWGQGAKVAPVRSLATLLSLEGRQR